MKIIYLPSNAQKKELLIAHRPIRLLLPAPPIEISDPLDWARSVLPQEFRALATEADERDVPVEPFVTRVRPASTLTELLGAIDHGGSHAWRVRIACVAVLLAPAKAQRHAALPAQWPRDVTIDGKSLFAPREAP